jgi:uncharacterized phage-associated protein
METSEKSDRLMEAACAVLSAAPQRRLNAVVLNKVLFYLDLAALRDRGETITGNSYVALQQGPVVAKYPQRLIGQLESRGMAKQISEWDGSKPVLLEQSPQHFNYVDADAMALVSAVTAHFADATSREVSDYSHDNPGWQLAWNEYCRTNKLQSINLRIALQQIVEDDPWMDSPLLKDDEILAAADAAAGGDW